MAKLSDIISTFTETDLDLTIPLELQDVSEEDMPVVNAYNAYLADNAFATANTYRNEHPELEKYILDVKKYNILQALVINSYLYAKDQKQQCQISSGTPDGQIEGDIWFKINEESSENNYSYCTAYYKDSDGTYKEFSLLSSAMFEEVTDEEIENIFIKQEPSI